MSKSHEGRIERLVPQHISYPEQLPVVARKDEIMRAIAENQVVVIAGETGSGKTTQLPKMCLELGRGREKRIGHTQPRRIAARAVSSRIAEELNTTVGGLVGYQVRFNDDVTEQTAVKVMTDGILLTELSRDRQLQAYDTLIIDEAHERSLNIDFILGYLKRLLPKRPDLKVIITSATIDVERFSQHFNDAPVIEVSGRTYPVDVHYLDSVEDRDRGLQRQVSQLVDDIEAERYGPCGDVLVFCPGERQIRDLAKELRGRDRIQVLPLYARLSNAEQNRVFNRTGAGMRVVLATNVAETSLTVPGIRYVIDPGDARISRYSHRSGLQRLPIESISQASANQRKGRCGRVAEGVCFRLYSEQDFVSRPEFTDAEILRTNLASVILRMLELGLGDVRQFPFVDPPDPTMVRDGFRLLTELGAVDGNAKLTPLGRAMAKLPVDPKLSRILLDAASRDCLSEALVIISALSVQDPRERPQEKRAQSDQQHARFNNPQSDFIAWLNLWQYLEEQRQALSQNQFRKLCDREFLSYLRIREWREVHYQLVVSCRQMKFRVT
ncbi:MAG: ATP-dependent RNA helicase HrpA, partial [Pseudomonadota bacterium]|nr:ATP-dependent RNA helicase HrpA [Pseudomonadota bacterium]